MTEDEMKQTWCPDARFVDAAQTATGEFVGDQQSWNRRRYISNTGMVETCLTHCLGRQCSAWRWEPLSAGMIGPSGPANDQQRSDTHGYCGRAGRP